MNLKIINRKRSDKSVLKNRTYIGEIRSSQLLSTFGIGSIVDFVKDTAIIGGVDDWDSGDFEDRKIVNESLRSITGAEYFIAPKTDTNKFSPTEDAVTAFSFPRKLHCPYCSGIMSVDEMESGKNSWQCVRQAKNGERCKGHPLASRFVIVCDRGHIDDFPYSKWVHNGSPCQSGKGAPRIEMFNAGGRSDAESLFLRCLECNAIKSMSGVFSVNALSGKIKCSGKHPHLGDFKEDCECVPRVMLRSSTSVYFPVNYCALIIPPWSKKAIEMVEKRYSELKYMSDESRTKYMEETMLANYRNITLRDLIEAFNILQSHSADKKPPEISDIYASEYNVLCRGDVDADRYRSHSVSIPKRFEKFFDSVTVIDHLVVTKALKGFTRINPYGENDSAQIVPLSRSKKEWLPAVELNGEGIFIKFNEPEIEKWVERVGNRYDEMEKNFGSAFFKFEKYSPKYVMMHTFAHLFIRQAASECGYSAASIQERIYSDFTNKLRSEKMSGVLVYLSSPDSEGSLGGLVSVAENMELFEKILSDMLDEARWCSSDPICMMSTHQGFASLNYAACYACTLLPETSCEFRNLFLDRVSIVGTTDNPELGFLGNIRTDND